MGLESPGDPGRLASTLNPKDAPSDVLSMLADHGSLGA